MRKLRLIAPVLGLVVCAGCASTINEECIINPRVVDLNIVFEGFDEHVGQAFKVRTILPSGNEADRKITAVSSPDFEVRLSTFCQVNRIDFYADVDGDNTYDPPPTDHAWRIDSVDVRGHLTLVFPHDSNHVDIQFPD